MPKDHFGFVILTHSPHHELVRLTIAKEPQHSFFERAKEWYGKDVQFDVYAATNKKRLKEKFQSVFAENKNTSSLFYKKDKMNDYFDFLDSIGQRKSWEEKYQKITKD